MLRPFSFDDNVLAKNSPTDDMSYVNVISELALVRDGVCKTQTQFSNVYARSEFRTFDVLFDLEVFFSCFLFLLYFEYE